MKRIPPGQIDRLGRALEKVTAIYIERWLKKGYLGAEAFDEQFCKLFEMINAEANGASQVSSRESIAPYSRTGQLDEEFDEDPYPYSGTGSTRRRPSYPPSGRSYPSVAATQSQSRSRTYGSRRSYQPKSSYYKRRNR